MKRLAALALCAVLVSGQLAAASCPMGGDVAAAGEMGGGHAGHGDAGHDSAGGHTAHAGHDDAGAHAGHGAPADDDASDDCRLLMTCGAVAVTARPSAPRVVAAGIVHRSPAAPTAPSTRALTLESPPPRTV